MAEHSAARAARGGLEVAEYELEFNLRPEVARSHDWPTKLIVKFPDAESCESALRHAQSGLHRLTLNLGDGRLAELHPKAWLSVIMRTPQQLIVTPSALKANASGAMN